MITSAAATTVRTSYFAGLRSQPPDPLLALIAAFREDPRPQKIDLGVGVFRDAEGRSPILSAVKRAEDLLFQRQITKAYLGSEGDRCFIELLAPIVLGHGLAGEARTKGLQTPGGTGALRLAGELVARTRPASTIWIGTPTWPNHGPIFSAAGAVVASYCHFDVPMQRLCFDRIWSALSQARPGDVAVFHGCCHNPTGADFTRDQWHELGRLLNRRRVLPLIDLAYQGFGEGLDADARGARDMVEICGEALVAYSCDKNFGLYRERTGALFVVGSTAAQSELVYGNLLALARANWSMPPDHGAAVVRVVLESSELGRAWRAELNAMRERLNVLRKQIATEPMLSALAHQKGLFATLPLNAAQIAELRDVHAIYMAGSGRVNIAGLNDDNVERFKSALQKIG